MLSWWENAGSLARHSDRRAPVRESAPWPDAPISSLRGHPVAVEAPWHAMLQLYSRNRRAREVLRVEHDHLAAIPLAVIPDREHPAVVFGRLRVALHEHRLSASEILPDDIILQL